VSLSPEVIVGLVSAALALLSAITAGVMATRSTRQAYDLERQRRKETEAEAAERILHQYRDPLLDAAHTLQARLYNIVRQDYLGRYLHCGDPDEERYARNYTLFAVAEYLCWVEILRRELRFLDLGKVDDNRKLLALLTQVQYTFQTERIRAPFQLFRGKQRAIAEVTMIATNAIEGPRTECMGYATFAGKLDSDPEFARWFAPLSEDIDTVARSGDEQKVRLTRLQRDLIDLIDFLDKDSIRIPNDFRARLPEPSPEAIAAAR
jgi:hypothetical protein